MKPRRYLVDTIILHLYVADKEALRADVLDILTDQTNLFYVSSKSVEELIYQQQSGRINVKEWKSPKGIAEGLVRYITEEMNYEIKTVDNGHLRTLAGLPIFPKHKDPTDRIIVAQAIAERIPLISSDTKFHDYKRLGLEYIFNEL